MNEERIEVLEQDLAGLKVRLKQWSKKLGNAKGETLGIQNEIQCIQQDIRMIKREIESLQE